MNPSPDPLENADRSDLHYSAMASQAAAQVIESYSTSFSMSTALLGPQTCEDIQNLYAVVRIADEIVDGAAAAAGLTQEDVAQLLAEYEEAVLSAGDKLFNTDPVLHAFGETVRRCNLRKDHLQAFFNSMRMDLDRCQHDEQSLKEYIYGSAEVIGLMCLQIFLGGRSVGVRKEEQETLELGARSLGAAFQKINFLRDLGKDRTELGRAYFPQMRGATLREEDKQAIIEDIRHDLQLARRATSLLPASAEYGVSTATALFEELTERLSRTPVEEMSAGRVRVGTVKKVSLAAGVTARLMRRGGKNKLRLSERIWPMRRGGKAAANPSNPNTNEGEAP